MGRKTEEIAEYLSDPSSGQVTLRYRSSPKEYSYRHERVRLLVATAVLNPVEVQLRIGGRLLTGVDSITEYPGFYLVRASGRRKLYAASQVSVERDVAVEPAHKIALEYFRAVADLVSIKTEEGRSLLAGQYKYLKRVSDSCVLAAYLKPYMPLVKQPPPGTLIYPFGTNASQKAAVEATFQSQVTIVQGPPGTGKTQTILNIVANALRRGLTVAVVSNNNAATKNVATAGAGMDLVFCWPRLGSVKTRMHLSRGSPAIQFGCHKLQETRMM